MVLIYEVRWGVYVRSIVYIRYWDDLVRYNMEYRTLDQVKIGLVGRAWSLVIIRAKVYIYLYILHAYNITRHLCCLYDGKRDNQHMLQWASPLLFRPTLRSEPPTISVTSFPSTSLLTPCPHPPKDRWYSVHPSLNILSLLRNTRRESFSSLSCLSKFTACSSSLLPGRLHHPVSTAQVPTNPDKT